SADRFSECLIKIMETPNDRWPAEAKGLEPVISIHLPLIFAFGKVRLEWPEYLDGVSEVLEIRYRRTFSNGDVISIGELLASVNSSMNFETYRFIFPQLGWDAEKVFN